MTRTPDLSPGLQAALCCLSNDMYRMNARGAWTTFDQSDAPEISNEAVASLLRLGLVIIQSQWVFPTERGQALALACAAAGHVEHAT